MKLRDLLDVMEGNLYFMLVMKKYGLKFKTWNSVEGFRTCEEEILNKEINTIYNTVDGMNVVLKSEEVE